MPPAPAVCPPNDNLAVRWRLIRQSLNIYSHCTFPKLAVYKQSCYETPEFLYCHLIYSRYSLQWTVLHCDPNSQRHQTRQSLPCISSLRGKSYSNIVTFETFPCKKPVNKCSLTVIHCKFLQGVFPAISMEKGC